jgi:uncharacterized protein
VNVLVLADTHIPDHASALPEALLTHLEWAELILHGGDATSSEVLTELEGYAPVHAVLGNIDGWDVRAAGVPEQLQLSLGGVEVAMVHDAGSRQGREARLRKRFPAAAVIVFAHSHQPVNELVDGVLFLNPGSPTWKRRAAHPSVLRLVIGPEGPDATLIQLTSR